MKEENKCESDGLVHAWHEINNMIGFYTIQSETCANCGLKRTKHSHTEEWWSYSDNRPNEIIITMRPQ